MKPHLALFLVSALASAVAAAESKLIGQWKPPQVGISLPTAGFPAVSPDGSQLALAGTYGGLTIWDAKTGQQVRVLAKPNVPPGIPRGPQGALQLTASTLHSRLAWTADGQRLMTFDAPMLQPGAGTLRIFDTKQGKLAHSARLNGPPTPAAPSLALSTDGKRVAATLSKTKSITVWDTSTGQVSVTLPVADVGHALAFTPDGHSLAAATLDKVELHDLSRKGEKRTIATVSSSLLAIAFTADGKSLLTLETIDQKPSLRFWDVATGQSAGPTIALAAAPQDLLKSHLATSGTTLAMTTEPQKVVVFDTRTGQSVAEVTTPANVLALSLSNTGQFLGVCCGDTTLLVWELPSM